jgi:ferritin
VCLPVDDIPFVPATLDREGVPMISKPVSQLLVAQIAHELNAHQTYMGMSLYFDRQSLKGWARFFHGQSVEEAGHATKIIEFLIDNEVEFNLPQVGGAPTTYGSAQEACATALANEVRVTEQFNAMATAATDAGDHRSLQFLQWFIEEQVEEERTMHALLELIDSGINLFQAESYIEAITG